MYQLTIMLCMRKNVWAPILLLLSLLGLMPGQDKEPVWAYKFQNYVVTELFQGKPARPILASESHRAYRTRIREAAKKGPNFAGHYTIADWGCGSGCMSMVVVDAISGRVFDAPFRILGRPSSGENKGEHEYRLAVFRTKSRLLIADGCPEDEQTKCGSYYYEWKANKFKLLRYDPQR